MRRAAVAVFTAMLIPATPAAAEPLVGVTGGRAPALVVFDSASPSKATIHPIQGLVSADEEIAGLDLRGAALQLIAVTVVDAGATDTLRVYKVDPGTGKATAVGAPITGIPDGDTYGVDINWTADRVRVVNDNDANLRINPATGTLVATDTNLTPAGEQITGIAYESGTLFGLSATTGNLYKSAQPNSGVMSLVANPLNGPLGPAESLNFDISLASDRGYFTAWLPNLPFQLVLDLDLRTGSAAAIGFPAVELRALAWVPSQVLQFAAANVTQSEASGAANFTVTRVDPVEETTEVSYAASDGSASGTLAFAPGETTKTISVPIANDALDGPDRTVTLRLQPTDALTGAVAPATLTITDDDATPDRTPPTLKVSAPTSMTFAKFVKGVKVTVTPSEPAKLEVALAGTISSARISAYNTTLASKTLALAGGARSVTLKPSKKLVGKPRKKVKVRITVTATDSAGNRVSANRTLTVKRPG